ncbi:MAG: hypothetical protein IPM57_07540 [Oligoflexia bacterium]|nr:hypothetical protein [Oligoflexia bacterium]
MRKSIGILVIGSLLGLNAPAQNDHHHNNHNVVETTKANPAQRFTVDQDLRTRMDQIMNNIATASTLLAGQKIEQNVQDIFKNCKLEPAADKAIHSVLAEILAGANLLKKGDQKKGTEKIQAALLKYKELFDHK